MPPTSLRPLLLLTVLLTGSSAPPHPSAASCPCRAQLEMTIQNVEETYIGYRLEVTEATSAAYDARKARALEAASRPDADCFLVIRDWIDGFGDAHLFLLENPRFDNSQLDSLRRTAVLTEWTEAALRRDFTTRADRLDPIEGLWYGRDGRYGIVRDGDAFVAVVLHSGDEGWIPGMEKARLHRHPDGGFDTIWRMPDHSIRRYPARLHRGNLLVVTGGIGWAREFPRPTGSRPLDSVDPLAPTLETLEKDVLLVSLPTHDPSYRSRLDSLVRSHHERLATARLLIVDIRGNGGGSSLTTTPLMPYVHATPEREVPGPKGEPVVLASADNLAYFTRWKRGDQTPAWLNDLLSRMGRSFGEIVPFQDPPDTTRAWVPDTTYAGPRHVAILVDGGVGSAAEAFLLFALHSPRVTVFGEPTWGMIDYQNVGIVRVGCPDAGLLLGYPTIAASAALPEGGLNATGILPHVELDAADPTSIQRVRDHYDPSRRGSSR